MTSSKALVCDFTKINVYIYLFIAEKLVFPPFEHAPFIIEGIKDLSHGATSFPNHSIIFNISRDSQKHITLATVYH